MRFGGTDGRAGRLCAFAAICVLGAGAVPAGIGAQERPRSETTVYRDGDTEVTTTIDRDAFPWERLAGDAARSDALHADRRLLHNSYLGAVGGIRAVDAGSGPKGSFRVGLLTEGFVFDGFIEPGDGARHFGGALSLSYTPHRNLEVFGALEATSDRNRSDTPDRIRTIGDTTIGLKAFHSVNPWLTLGGDVSVAFLNRDGGVKDALRSTSAGLRANLSADLRRLGKRTVPVIIRFNTQYWLDNSEHMVEGLENDRYNTLIDAAPRTLETRHLVSPAERFATQVNRVDRVNFTLGFEAPLKAGRVGLHPIAEWTWAVPVNRQGHRCAFVPELVPGAELRGQTCLEERKAKAFPMTALAGLRILPPVRGLAFTVGVEAGILGSRRDFVAELAPTAPYRVFAGVSYAYGRPAKSPAPVEPHPADPEPEPTPPEDPTPESQVEEPSSPVLGLAEIQVSDERGMAADVPLVLEGPETRSLKTNKKGRVTAEDLKPGAYKLRVASERHLVAIYQVDIDPKKRNSVVMQLLRRPKKPKVAVGSKQLTLRRQIRFASGSDRILARSEGVLAEVVDALLRSPQIRLVEIQGHTDNRGKASVNRRLSQRRAAAVRQWLTDHGVEPERLRAKGYGSSAPLAPNITSRNRARNRRVQFRIRARR